MAALLKNSHVFTHTFYVLVWHLAIADTMYLAFDLVLVVPATFANALPFGEYWTNVMANLDTLCWNMICLLLGAFYGVGHVLSTL